MDDYDIKQAIINILSDLFFDEDDAGDDGDIDFEIDIEYGDLIDDYGMDSMSFISLVVGLENEFGIKIPDEMLSAENFRTLQMIFSRVKELIDEDGNR